MKLPADRLPKGTRLALVVLAKRCKQLEQARVSMPRSGVIALAKVIDYLGTVLVEGGSK